MARKGWDSLSDKYRARLERNGVTRSGYESGTSLGKARGHIRTPGQPSERYQRLERKANKIDGWQRGYSARETIQYAMAEGFSMAEIQRLLDTRMLAHELFQSDHGGPGSQSRALWDSMTPEERERFHALPADSPIRALYWYH